MTCNHCKNNMEKALLLVEGVESVEIDLTNGRAVVTGKAKTEELTKAVKSIGFEVK